MKLRVIKYTLPILLLCMSIGVMAQNSKGPNSEKKARADSLLRAEEKRDADNLSDLKSEKNDTKAKAKEAQRVERNASTAARESEIAYRSEQRAQKSRRKADRQAKKAEKARVQADKNQ